MKNKALNIYKRRDHPPLLGGTSHSGAYYRRCYKQQQFQFLVYFSSLHHLLILSKGLTTPAYRSGIVRELRNRSAKPLAKSSATCLILCIPCTFFVNIAWLTALRFRRSEHWLFRSVKTRLLVTIVVTRIEPLRSGAQTPKLRNFNISYFFCLNSELHRSAQPPLLGYSIRSAPASIISLSLPSGNYYSIRSAPASIISLSLPSGNYYSIRSAPASIISLSLPSGDYYSIRSAPASIISVRNFSGDAPSQATEKAKSVKGKVELVREKIKALRERARERAKDILVRTKKKIEDEMDKAKRLKKILKTLWRIRIWFFKLYMHVFLRIYWVFMHSEFGRITFIPFFWTSLLVADEYPLLALFYLYILFTAFTLYLFCRIYPPFHEWLNSNFGEERLKRWVGNAPFHMVKRHGIGIATYFIFRSADNIINDYRVERKADAMLKHLERSSNSLEKTPTELERIWDKAERSVGPSFTNKIETGVSNAIKGAIKSILIKDDQEK